MATVENVDDVPELLNASIFACILEPGGTGCNRTFIYSNNTEPYDPAFDVPVFCPCCGVKFDT